MIPYRLADLLDEYGDEKTSSFLSTYRCSRDSDCERYLKEKAITHDRNSISKTYLILNGNKLRGYFTLAIKCMKINEKIIYDHELIRWMNPNRGIVQSYLIGQISKADGESKEIGKMMMDMAMRIFSEGENNFGCRTVRLDCKKPLIGYYEGHGFRYIGKNEDGTLNQMAYIFE